MGPIVLKDTHEVPQPLSDTIALFPFRSDLDIPLFGEPASTWHRAWIARGIALVRLRRLQAVDKVVPPGGHVIARNAFHQPLPALPPLDERHG